MLATLGKEAMAPASSMYGAEVWQALAASPEAAALFMKQNMPYLVAWINAGDHGTGLPNSQASAFAAMLAADIIRIKDRQLGGQLVSDLVKNYASNQGTHAPAALDAAYGKMFQAYWRDVMFSITSMATDPHGYLKSHDGMKLAPGQWAVFVREAMRNSAMAASLLVNAHAQDQYWLKKANAMPGKTGDSYALQAGLVAGFFDSNATMSTTRRSRTPVPGRAA